MRIVLRFTAPVREVLFSQRPISLWEWRELRPPYQSIGDTIVQLFDS